MLSQGQPGLLSAVLIALAGGWVASRLLHRALESFPSLIVGVCGAVLGMMLLGPIGLQFGPLWLLATSLAGGVLILALGQAVAEKWRNRNRLARDEFDERGSTGRSQEEVMDWIVAIIIGIIAGWLAEKIMRRNHGLLTNLIVGLIGGLIGKFIADMLDLGLEGWLSSLIFATLGAVILLFIVGLFTRNRTAV